MSTFTSIILYISAFEEEKERITEVNSFRSQDQDFSLIDLSQESLPDAFPRFLYAGTYKNFPTAKFIDHLLKNVRWEYPKYVQLFVQEESDYTLKVYGNAGRDLLVDSYKETDDH
jgi:hypothetical protein